MDGHDRLQTADMAWAIIHAHFKIDPWDIDYLFSLDQSSLAARLSQWLSRRCSSQQWTVDRHDIRQRPYAGVRPRVLLSRIRPVLQAGLQQDTGQQASPGATAATTAPFPFANPRHYANWQAGRAQVWIWDQAALLERLPQAARYSVLPDSALSLNSPLRW